MVVFKLYAAGAPRKPEDSHKVVGAMRKPSTACGQATVSAGCVALEAALGRGQEKRLSRDQRLAVDRLSPYGEISAVCHSLGQKFNSGKLW
mgnify:CR=1 FL=1